MLNRIVKQIIPEARNAAPAQLQSPSEWIASLSAGQKLSHQVFLISFLRSQLFRNFFYAALLFVGSASAGFGQTTLFSDNFGMSRGFTYSAANGAIGDDSNWVMSRAGADWGARIHGGRLDLSNDASGTSNANGWVFGYRDINALSGWNTTLSSNTGTITWEFNMRQIRTDPSGFGSSDYGVAFVLAGNSTSANNTGSGYAVVLGEGGATDPIRLVSFLNGVQGTRTTILTSNTAGLTDFGNEYLSIRVTYIPSSNTWELFVRNDGTSAFTDPTSGSLTSQGTAVNSTYTSTSGMRYLGGYWHGSTAASQTAFFDNVFLKKTEAPTGVSTGTAGSITATGATISGSNVTADGGSAITERGVVYATTSNPTISNSKVTAAGTTGSFDSTLTDLSPSTTYYVRAYATNSIGTTYGSEAFFTTTAGTSPTLSAVTLASALSTTNGTASPGVSFTASGTNLSANILVTAQSGYEVSTSEGTGYGGSVSVSSGTTVYVRFAANQPMGTYNSAAAAVLSSAGASNVNVTTSSSGNTVTAAPVVIFTEGLNQTTTHVTASGGDYISGNSLTTTWPNNVDLFSEGTHSYRVTNGTGTITSAAIDTTYGSLMSLSFRLAAFAGTSNQGMEDSDTVTLATSTDNGTTWSSEILVTGTNNSRWSFGGGTGNASEAYDGNNIAASFSPASGGEKTSDGYSTVHLSGLPQASQFRFRITAVNSSAEERWHIDQIVFRGVLPTVNVSATNLAAFTATAGTASANQTFTVNGTNLISDITVGPLTGFEFSTDGTSYSSSVTLARSGDSVANTTVHVRLAANAQLGTYNSQAISIASTGAITKTVTTTASGNSMSANPTDISAFATAVTQDFNALANSGTSSTMPTSWYFLESGTGADGNYTASSTSSSGETFSMGASSNSERALGSIRTGGFNSTFGVALRNTTGSTITVLRVAYTGETWRVASANRVDRVDFAYSTDAATLASGTWTEVNSLDYANPGQTTGSGSMQHSAAIAHTITGLSIPNNAMFFLRWADADATGNDDMMGIDDVSITAVTNPAVTTGSIASITATSATITTSEVTSTGGDVLTARGVVYGTTASPTLANSVATDGGTSAGTFNTPLTGLTAGTTYFVRAYATNGASTSYGSEISFVTLPAQAATPTGGAYLEAGTGFTASWSAVAGATGYRLDVATDAGFSSLVTGFNNLAVAGTSQAITGLAAGTTYYIRVRAENASGAGASSEMLTITTIPSAPVLTRASNPTASSFTVNWGAVTGAANYTVVHSANRNMSGATSVDTASTSLTLNVGAGLRYVQVRANNDAGSSANSTMQVNQLRSINAGATVFLSVPGVVNGGNATFAEIFGSNNEAGLASNGTPSNSTNIIRLNADGSSQSGVIFASGIWRRGETNVNSEIIPEGKAFMLRNNSAETDHILLVGNPADGPRAAVAVTVQAGRHALMTPARTQPTTLNGLNLRPAGGNSTNQVKTSNSASTADMVIIPRTSGSPLRYFFDATMNGGTGGWRTSGGMPVADPSSITVPAGGAFFIRKAPDSNFSEWTPPAEE